MQSNFEAMTVAELKSGSVLNLWIRPIAIRALTTF
jgi:hypothetical protein